MADMPDANPATILCTLFSRASEWRRVLSAFVRHACRVFHQRFSHESRCARFSVRPKQPPDILIASRMRRVVEAAAPDFAGQLTDEDIGPFIGRPLIASLLAWHVAENPLDVASAMSDAKRDIVRVLEENLWGLLKSGWIVAENGSSATDIAHSAVCQAVLRGYSLHGGTDGAKIFESWIAPLVRGEAILEPMMREAVRRVAIVGPPIAYQAIGKAFTSGVSPFVTLAPAARVRSSLVEAVVAMSLLRGELRPGCAAQASYGLPVADEEALFVALSSGIVCFPPERLGPANMFRDVGGV
eukprot:Opistho-1_new@40226